MPVPCGNFYPEIVVVGDECVVANLSGDGSCDTPYVIDVSASISADAGNAIECRSDGFYAKPEILCYRINLSIPDTLSTGTTCQVCEPIPSGSSVSFLTPYLDQVSTGVTIYSVTTTTGGSVATLTIPAGSHTGIWSPAVPWIAPNAVTICGSVISTGTGGCGLSVPIQVCDPDSAYASPADFYDNLDPVRLCSIIAQNCNATMIQTGPGTFTFTGNDGTQSIIDLSALIDVCQEVADNCNASLVSNPDGSVTFTDNTGAQTTLTFPTAGSAPSATWPYSCPITSGQKVWLGSDGLLYTDPKPINFSSSASSGVGAAATLAAGQTYREFSIPVTNTDTCGRVMDVHLNVQWSGFNATMPANGELAIHFELDIGGGSGFQTYGDDTLQNFTTISRTISSAGISTTANFSLSSGQTKTIRARYRVQLTTAGNVGNFKEIRMTANGQTR